MNAIVQWVERGSQRITTLHQFNQPLTTKQLCQRTQKSYRSRTVILRAMVRQKLLMCLNPQTQSSRVYWLTSQGLQCQQAVRTHLSLSHHPSYIPEVNWVLYGSVCFAHREAMLLNMNEQPMQPPAVRRKACIANSALRMGHDHARNVMYYLRNHKLVEPVKVPKREHWHYALTPLGAIFQELLLRAKTPLP